MLSTLLQSGSALIVTKEKIAANGDWNLSGERYREGVSRIASYPEVALADLLEVQSGFPFRSEFFNCEKGFPLVRIRDIKPNRTATLYSGEYTKEYIVNNGDLIVGMDGEFNSVIWNGGPALLNQRVSRLHSFRNCLKEYVALLIPKRLMEIEDGTYSVTVKHLSSKQILGIEIPLPPLEVQKEIVVEIEGYQKVIDGARMVVDNYRPHIPIDPSWPMVELGDSSLFRVESGGTPRSNVPEYWDGGISWATLVDLPPADLVTQITSTVRTISDKGLKESSAKLIPADSVIVSTRATIGRIAINRIPITTNQGFKNIIIEDKSRAIPEFVALAISRLVPTMKAWATGGTFAEISKSKFCELDIPLPPLEVQKELVAEIETEQAMVSVNRELIARFEKKIQITLARVWGEEKSR